MRILVPAFLAAVVTAETAWAHTAGGPGEGLRAGFLHPLFGSDHIAAMVAVGLWGALLGNPALWLLPVAFPLVMAAGGVVAIAGVPIPGIKPGIALSAVVLGMMIAFAVRPPLWIALALVGTFAVFHGYAHGAELPPGGDAVTYSLGFVVATGLLHLCGIAIGALADRRWGRILVRTGGAGIAAAGLVFVGRLV